MKELMLQHAFTFVDRVVFLVGAGDGKNWWASHWLKAQWKWQEQHCLPNHRIRLRRDISERVVVQARPRLS